MASKKTAGRAAGKRVSAKISHLVRTGEMPNTPKGRKQAAGMAYGMEHSGRLGPKGGYRRGAKR